MSACQQKTIEEFTDKDGNLVIREWYNKSQIKSIKTFTNPEHTSFRYMTFYRDGLLRDSAVFVNGKVTGLRKYYEASSGLTHLENYKNGLLNGPQRAVFNTGISSFQGFRKDNNKVGEWKFFFPSGKIITYEYYDSTGRLKYLKKYDENGSILKTDGEGLIDVVMSQNPFKIDESVTGKAFVALPLSCSYRLTIKDITNGINNQLFFDKQITESPVSWEIIFDTPGEKKLLFTLVIIEDKSGKEEQSELEHLLYIEPN
jgi:hypothetical protein